MSIETQHRGTKRWLPEADPGRKNLEGVLAFAYGMQMGHLRRIADELTQLARQARLATMASGAAIAVEHQHRIECIARSGEAAPQLGSRPAANIGLAGECLRTALPQFCGDTEIHPFVDRMHSRTFGVRSIVYVPVFRGVKPEGVIGVFADKPNHFTPHDVRVLQIMAREVTRTLKWELAPEVEPKAMEPPRDTVVAEPRVPEKIFEVEAVALPEPEMAAPEKPVDSLGAALIATGSAATLDQGLEAHAEPAPAFEPDLTVSLEPPQEELFASAGEPTAEEIAKIWGPDAPAWGGGTAATDFDWARREDRSYPAKATGYLFAEDHPVRRMASIFTLVAMAVGVILAVWWAVPRVTASRNIESTADYIAGKARAGGAPGELLSGEVGTSASLAFVRDIRTQVSPGHVFVTIYLSAPVQHKSQANGDHIYVDLQGVQLSPLLKATKVDPAGPIAQFKLEPTGDPGAIRLGMLLDAPCTFLESVTTDPQAIVIDVQPQKGIRPGR